ncbi:MAG TPA: methyltransferase [Nocardioides sp.]|nr:methyltransferase [Nocardioides sp.]
MSPLESSPAASRTFGQIDFGGLTISYDATVLPPRRWTSMQSIWAAGLLRNSPPGKLLELCAGAGQIGLLTVAMEPRPLLMVDLNPQACEIARSNAAANGLVAPVDVRHGDLQDVIRADEQFVGVIADPPWVPSAETGRYPGDPLHAIDGGHDGLDVVRSCLRVISRHLTVGGWALLQLGTEAQAAAVAEWSLAEGLGLAVCETRVYPERGVLVRLAATG